MAVTLTRQPIQAPLHNPTDGVCTIFGMNMPIADLVQIVPEKNIMTIEVPASPATAGSFNFHGHTFSAGGSGFTSSTFQVVAMDQYQTAKNMANMLKSNLDIYPNYLITVAWSGNPLDSAYMTAEANEWGYVEPGTFSNSLGWPSTYQAGEAGFYQETKKMSYQLFSVDEFDYETPLTPLQVFKPRLNLNNYSTWDLEVDFAKVIKTLPITLFPYLNSNVARWDPNIIKKLYLKYGSVNNVNCFTLLTEFQFSPEFWVINQAIDFRNQGGPKDFSFNLSPQHLAKPLNYGPTAKIGYCRDSFNWLWFNFNFRLFGGAYASWYGAAQIRQYDSSGVQIGATQNIPFDPSGGGNFNGVGVGILPIGGANFPGTLNSNTCYAEVKFMFQDELVGFSEQEQLSVPIIINYSDCDCEPYEFYFLTEYGGYDTIRFQKFEEVTTKVSQVDISYDKFCRDFEAEDSVADYYEYLSKAGNKQSRTIANRRFRVTTSKLPKREEIARYFEMFLKSENRKFRLTNTGASKLGAVNINITSSDSIIFKEEGKVIYSFEFQFAQDFATISER